jgi:ribonuclease P protein component
MISRRHRFHGHNSLNFVYRHGRTVRGSLFTLKHVLNDRRSEYRVAIVVSKKVSKSAVTRNRMRRRIYEQIRLHEALIDQPHDIVITVFHERVADMPMAELSQLLREQLQQAGLVRKLPPPKKADML